MGATSKHPVLLFAPLRPVGKALLLQTRLSVLQILFGAENQTEG